MTGVDHYRQAERIIREVTTRTGALIVGTDTEAVLKLALVHATLADAAATALSTGPTSAREWQAWDDAAGASVNAVTHG